MESPQPPIKSEIVITKTLPIPRQKSNFEKQLDSFRETLALQQAQLDLFKTGLSDYQHQTNKDHKQLKTLNKGFGGFIEDQGRTNRELKTNMGNLDTEQLSLNELIKAVAEACTDLDDRVQIIEQNNSTNQSRSSIPKIVITAPIDTQKNILPRSNSQQYILNELALYKKDTHEKFKKLEKTIIDLIELKTEQEDALLESQKKIEQNEKDIAALKVMVQEQQTLLKNMLDNKNSS